MGATTLQQHLHLPDGYRVSEGEGSLRLFNPQGALLEEIPRGLAAASEVRSRAWLDAWEQIEDELKEELRALRGGTRPLHELHRMRQYMRMLDAMARQPAEARERLRAGWHGAIAGMALATAAAAIAVVILATTPVEIVRNPQEDPGSIRISPPATIPATKAPASVAESKPRRRAAGGAEVKPRPASRPVDVSARRARTVGAAGGAAGLSAITGYAVGFGEFASHAPAEIRMRLIRAKGYVVYVAQVGSSFHVVTRPYRAREHAERLANALTEIGLPATIRAATTPLI